MGNKPEVSEKQIDGLIQIWDEYIDRQEKVKGTESFVINPETATVRRLAKGVLGNEKVHGLKFCPCRIKTGRFEEDMELVCPCNFQIQQQWKKKNACYCDLFLKENEAKKRKKEKKK